MDSNRHRFDLVEKRARAFFNRPEIKAPIDFLCAALPERAQLYVAGGAIRNVIISQVHGFSPPTRDVDLFVGNLDARPILATALGGQRIERSDLGGLRWFPLDSTYCFDISLLSDFLIIKKYRLETTRASLLRSVDFDVNAVVFDFKGGRLYERHCLKAIASKTMRFNTRRFADKALLAFRALNIRHKINFALGEDIFLFLKAGLDIDTSIQVKAIMMEKLGRKTTRAVLQDLKTICVQKDYQAYRAAMPS